MSRPPLAKRKQLLFVLGALLALAALGVISAIWLAAPSAPRFLTEKVVRGEVVQTISATGTLQPVVLSPVGSQVSGIVWKIHADYNDMVRKGQVLVELDPALFESAVRREEANVISARALLSRARAELTNNALVAKRSQALVNQHFAALAERDAAVANEKGSSAGRQGAKANVLVAQAALERARLDLKNSVILSPVDGVVIARNVEVGQAVVSSFQAPNIYSIAQDLSQMQVLANVDEADIGYLKKGQRAQFTVDSYRGRRFDAEVAQVRNAPQTLQNVVTYVVVMNVNNRELLLKPGMTANVRLEVARAPDALLITNSSLRFKPKLDPAAELLPPSRKSGDAASPQATIYVAEGKKIRPVTIVPGISDGMVTEVKSGLTEGDVVVIDVKRPSGSGAAASAKDAARNQISAAKGFRKSGM